MEYTDKVVYLDDEQIVNIEPGKELQIINLNRKSVEVDIKTVDLDISKLSKEGYDHFMLKEIFDQPQCLRDCMRGRLLVDGLPPREQSNRIVGSSQL